MNFSYKAKNNQGQFIEGTVSGQTQKQAVDNLRKQGLFVLEMNDSASKGKGIQINFKRKVSLKDKIIFTSQLAMMIKGGLPLIEALKALEEQTTNLTFRSAINKITEDVRGGTALSKALSKYPKIFPNLYIAVTASGEKSGKLDEVLNRLSEQFQKDYDLISKVKSAITYPIVIVIALIGLVILMLVFVVPQLETIFKEMGVQLPITTRILLGTSRFVTNYWYILLIILIGLFFLARWWFKTSSGGLFWDTFKIKVPIFGTLTKKVYMTRFTRTTATLVASGLPMLEILATVKEVVGNKYYSPMFEQISLDVESGLPLSLALRKHKIFPPMISQMVSVGEKSGKIDEVLNHLANFFDKEVEATTSNLASLIEPILILVIGTGIGLAIASVIMPIYSLVNAI